VNKKKQKNFVSWSAPTPVGAFQVNGSFLLLFFKKDAFLARLQPIDLIYYPILLLASTLQTGILRALNGCITLLGSLCHAGGGDEVFTHLEIRL